jgi:pyrimidine operon attenuation protein/uracil phosphoribosyltransferase
MADALKTVPKEWKLVVNSEAISRTISRLSYEILEKGGDLSKLAIVGIRTGGEFIAKRIQKRLEEIEKRQFPIGSIDITLYRDDISFSRSQPVIKGSDLPFNIAGSRIILVDDVLYTGRTIRAALDAIIDFGRPMKVELAALVDRGHRELPIRPDYIGKNIPTSLDQFVRVRLRELGYEDGVYLMNRDKK